MITEKLNFLYVQPDEWSRAVMYHFYNSEKPIENIFLGSSHTHCDVKPSFFDRMTGEEHYNLSTGSQSFSQSYLLLQEANKRYNIKKVYLEMYYYIHVKGINNYYEIEDHLRVWDYVKNSNIKYDSIKEQEPKAELIEIYLPFTRFRNYLFDEEYIKSQVDLKRSSDYINYLYKGKWEKGFWSTDLTMEVSDLSYSDSTIIGESPLLDEAREYLIKIIEYCKEEGIELVLFSSPIQELQIYSTENYDNYVKEIRNIAEIHGLSYYDFNLCKSEYLPIGELLYFSDMDHLNSCGAEIFTKVLYDVIINEKIDYFYESFEEKMRKSEATVYGLLAKEKNENGDIMYTIVSNREKECEYRIEFIPVERVAECKVIQEYDMNKEFVFSSEVDGKFLVSARFVGEMEPFMELEIEK